MSKQTGFFSMYQHKNMKLSEGRFKVVVRVGRWMKILFCDPVDSGKIQIYTFFSKVDEKKEFFRASGGMKCLRTGVKKGS